MRLFQHSQGFIIAFGFDVMNRIPSPRTISWSDPSNGSWEPRATNMAGSVNLSFTVDPQFVREVQDGIIVAYQPGKTIEMIPIGMPYVWKIRTLQSDQNELFAVA
jgi:hypothetical protein